MLKYLISIIIISPYFCISQSSFCNRSFEDSFFPLEIGFEKYFQFEDTYYTEKISDTVFINNKIYFQYLNIYESGDTTTYYIANKNDTILLYSKESKSDRILLINKAEKGLKWGDNEIITAKERFLSPYCFYKDLLVVETRIGNGNIKHSYYKKGLGLILIKINDNIISFTMPNKEESEQLDIVLSHPSCESLGKNDEIRDCTSDLIIRHIKRNINDLRLNNLLDSGTIEIELYFNKWGKLKKVTEINSEKERQLPKKLEKKVLKTFPRFRPTKTSTFDFRYSSSIKVMLPFSLKIDLKGE